ncbi:hypothetical protein Ancab_021450 [Ancistrocladus abbreviatus]
MRSIKLSVESRQERMVKQLEDLLLHLCSLRLVLQSQRLPIHNLHCVLARVIAPEPAQVNRPDVSASDPPHQLEVAEGERHFPAVRGGDDCFEGGIRGAVWLEEVETVVRVVIFRRAEERDGGGVEREPAAASVAFVADTH